jgi:hypothetical protein
MASAGGHPFGAISRGTKEHARSHSIAAPRGAQRECRVGAGLQRIMQQIILSTEALRAIQNSCTKSRAGLLRLIDVGVFHGLAGRFAAQLNPLKLKIHP